MTKKAFYSATDGRLVAYGYLEEFPGAVGEDVPDDFEKPLYATRWNGAEWVETDRGPDFSIVTPQ